MSQSGETADTLEALKTAKKIQVPFSEKEIEEVLNLLKDQDSFLSARNKLIVELFYSTGMRRGEMVNLKLIDVSFSQKTVKVLGKRNKERIVPLLPSVLKTANTYLTFRKGLKKIKDTDYFLLTEKGNKIYETFATHLLSEGADIKSVKELLGHSSLASTQIYANNSISKLKQVYKNSHPRNSN